jgi:peptidoglycan/LPS O-acetylase OafA/YrhL
MGAVRLFLALVVAYDHWRAFKLHPLGLDTIGGIDELGFNAGYAVMFFFVISGFLITYTLRRNYSDNLTGFMSFYHNRFSRIFSLYWPVIAFAFIFIPGGWTGFVSASLLDQFTQLFILGQDWRFALSYYFGTTNQSTVVGVWQSWTLGAELVFYLLAPLLLRSWKVATFIAFGSFALRMIFIATIGDLPSHPLWNYTFPLSTIGFFMIGHLAERLGEKLPVLRNPLFCWIFTSLSILVMALGSYRGFDSPRFWISVLLFAAGLPALFDLTKNNRRLNFVGELSYPLYLVHGLVFVLWDGAIISLALPYGARATALLYLAASVLTALAAHVILERPIRRLMGGRRRQSIVALQPISSPRCR